MHYPSNFSLVPYFSSSFLNLLLTLCVFAIKKCPKLKSRYKARVQAAVEYAKMIDDFDHLVNPKTLARHCLGPEPSPFVLRAIKIKEKSKFSF